ncbi:unnamed protein product [Amaranthus hypochondriacus]
MGNCCGSSSMLDLEQNQPINREAEHEQERKDEHEHEHEHERENKHEHEHDQHELEHDDDGDMETTSTIYSQSSTPFQRTPLNEMISTKARLLPLVDPRLVSLLDFFRQLYVRRKDIYYKIMPIHRKDLEIILNKIGNTKESEKENSKQGEIMMRQRSMSFSDVEGSLRMERFKVKPIDSGTPIVNVPPKDDQKGGGSKPTNSK